MTDQQPTVFDLAEDVLDLRQRLERANLIVSDIEKVLKSAESALADAMTDQELSSFKLAGRTFTVSTRRFSSVLVDRQPDIVRYCRDNDLDHLLVYTVTPGHQREAIDRLGDDCLAAAPSKEFGEWVREQRDAGVDLPEEVTSAVSEYTKTIISIRVAK